MRVERTALILIVTVLFIGLFVAVAFGSDEGAETRKYSELEDTVVFKRITPDDKIREVAVDVYYREALRLPVDEIAAYKKTAKIPFRASGAGFVNPLVPDFVFIDVGAGGDNFGLCAIYKPELDNVGAEEHKYFPNYMPHERSVDLPVSEKFLMDVAGLFEVYPELNKAEKALAISRLVFYIFYWDVMFGQAGYSFGDNPDGVYIVTDPLALLAVPAFTALDRSESFLRGRSTRRFLGRYPEGEPPTESYSFFDYSVYTWDLITRRLLLWYFSGDHQDNIYIKQIVFGRL